MIFDYIWDSLPQDPKELEDLIKAGFIYTPYIPLQITKLEINKLNKEKMNLKELQQKISQIEEDRENIRLHIKELENKQSETYFTIAEMKAKYILDSGILETLNWEVVLHSYGIRAPYDISELKELLNNGGLYLKAERNENVLRQWIKLGEHNGYLTITAYDQEMLRAFVRERKLKVSVEGYKKDQQHQIEEVVAFWT